MLFKDKGIKSVQSNAVNSNQQQNVRLDSYFQEVCSNAKIDRTKLDKAASSLDV